MSLTDFLVSHLAPLRRRLNQLNDMTRRLDDLQMAVGRVEQRLTIPDAAPTSPSTGTNSKRIPSGAKTVLSST